MATSSEAGCERSRRLVLLGLAGLRNSLLPRELIGQLVPNPAELRVRARPFCADCWSESKALASAPCDCPVTAALSAGLRPGLFRMLWY